MFTALFDLRSLDAWIRIQVDEEQRYILGVQVTGASFARGRQRPGMPSGGGLCREACRLLADYGRQPDERNARAMRRLPLDPRSGTDYQRRIWEAVRHIPPGETRSYAEVARLTGRPRAARAVGQAMRANPFFILVPCHRVIRSDKSPGGWSSSFPAGKMRLLRHERVCH